MDTPEFPTIDELLEALERRDAVARLVAKGRAEACELDAAERLGPDAYINNILATIDLDTVLARLVEVCVTENERTTVRYLAVLQGVVKERQAWAPQEYVWGSGAPGSLEAVSWFVGWTNRMLAPYQR